MHEQLGNLLTSTGQNRTLTFLIQLRSQVALTLKHYSQMCRSKTGWRHTCSPPTPASEVRVSCFHYFMFGNEARNKAIRPAKEIKNGSRP